MPLTLVLGPANSAKAGEVLGAYTLAARRGALLVVPTAADAAHYNRELASPRMALGRALTFPTLIEEIALRVGYDRRRLTTVQRERLLARAIASLNLRALSEPAQTPGFAHAAGHLISELRQARITPRRLLTGLRSWAEGVPERRPFASDLAAIYRAYDQAVEASERVDAESFGWGALDELRRRPDRWSGLPVFLYGFDDFTALELDAITTLARQAGAKVTVSLIYEPGRAALAARAGVVEDLRQQAQIVTELPPVDSYYEPQSRRALHHLERYLFEPDPPSAEPGEAIRLLEAGGERAEAELIAAEVLEALAEGLTADEIVIVCRSLQRSGPMLEATLRRYGLPVASARRIPLAHTALGRAILALSRSALRPASEATTADLLALLRAPGVSSQPQEVDRLEAALRRGGITRLAELRDPALRQIAHPALQAIAELRAAGDANAVLGELTRALFLVPHVQSGRLLSAEEQLDVRAANAILAALSELAELGNDGRGGRGNELVEVLEGLTVDATPGIAPGEVLIAEPLSIRARRFRRVIVAGLCEGEFPSAAAVGADPFLDDDRRHELALSANLVLPADADPLARERYLFYSCVSRATERVTFSYRSSDEEGNDVAPSVFLSDVADLLAPDWRERRRRRLLADVVWPEDEAPTGRERALARAVAVAAAGGEPQPAQAGAQPAQAQTGADATVTLGPEALSHVRHTRTVSAGALEAFAACPVRWLIERQLDARDLEPDPEPLARGKFIHAVLERVIASIEGPLDEARLPAAERSLR
ncbi:MAG TPA: PD-(D/E)XK nuclease family protein, partial [Solirubrobacteraceae bacterium]|nr:PD-(D/E)XK nuclease family protein [Solirubrobacteraceae bacterium]